jgi:dTDP-4-dehydrorhamnose 3,5-epimerase
VPFQFSRLTIPEIVLIEAKIMGDSRGFFQEMFKASAFDANGVPSHFVQDNHSRSQRGILRGLHYQLEPHAQGKLVMALRGGIFDVAVDIRRGLSPRDAQLPLLADIETNFVHAPAE